jgi:hypothetical protein
MVPLKGKHPTDTALLFVHVIDQKSGNLTKHQLLQVVPGAIQYVLLDCQKALNW